MVNGGREPVGQKSEGLFKNLLIIAIIGLVLFFVLPWVIAERDFEGENKYTCQNCGYASTEEYDFEGWPSYECPECSSENIKIENLTGKEYFAYNFDLKLMAGDEDLLESDELYGEGAGKIESITGDTIWLSFWGFLFILIIAIIYLILERTRQLYYFFIIINI